MVPRLNVPGGVRFEREASATCISPSTPLIPCGCELALLNPFSTQASGGKNYQKKIIATCWVSGDWPGSNSLAVSALPVPTVATLPILLTLCTEKRLETLQSVWRHFVLKTHKKLYERTRLYRSCCLRSYTCDERTKQPSQHAEERDGRSKLLKAQQGVVLENYRAARGRCRPIQAQIVGAPRKIQVVKLYFVPRFF